MRPNRRGFWHCPVVPSAWAAMLAVLCAGRLAASGADNTGAGKPVIAQYCGIFDFQGTNNPDWVYLLEHAPFDKLNRMYIAFAWIKDGLLMYNASTNNPGVARTNEMQKIDALVEACRRTNATAEIFISSGFDADGSMYTTAAVNPTAFATSVLAFLQRHNLDGYDMDWENGIDGIDMLALLQATRSVLQSNVNPRRADGRYFTTLATWPVPENRGYGDTTNLAACLDQINIMSYGTFDDGITDAEAWHAAGFPWQKLIVGVETECDYPESVDTLGPTGTIAGKCCYAVTNGLAGVMAWRLDNDYRAEAGQTPPAGAHPSFRGALAVYSNVTSSVPEPLAVTLAVTAGIVLAGHNRRHGCAVAGEKTSR